MQRHPQQKASLKTLCILEAVQNKELKSNQQKIVTNIRNTYRVTDTILSALHKWFAQLNEVIITIIFLLQRRVDLVIHVEPIWL